MIFNWFPLFSRFEFLEKIDSSIKSYDEYELLHKCSVTSVEFKETMDKLKTLVAINGDGEIMYGLSKEYYENNKYKI